MKFGYKGKIENLDVALKREGAKEGFIVTRSDDNVSLAFDLEHEKSKSYYPIGFKGKVSEDDGHAAIEGKINVGLYIYAIGVVLYALVIARLVFPLVNNQQRNAIIALVAFGLSVAITVVMVTKIKASKKRIVSFLANLSASIK